jgi:hypothetical protein
MIREEVGEVQRTVQPRNITANPGPKRTKGTDKKHERTNLLIQWAAGVSFSTIW